MDFAREQPEPRNILYEQLESIFLQQASQGFFTKNAIPKIFEIEKNEETGEINVLGLSKVDPETNEPPGIADQIKKWSINETPGKGDCLFAAIATILNSETETKNGIQTSTILPRIAKRNKKNGKIKLVKYQSIETNPYLYNGLYTSQTVRRAMGDYLRVNTRQFDSFYQGIPQDLPEMVKRQDQGETLTSGQKEDIRSYKFVLNKDNTEIEEKDTIIDIMTEPASEENIVKSEFSKPEIRENRTPDKYFWGESVAFISLELIFNIKFMIFDLSDELSLNSRVEFDDNGQTRYGVVKQMNDTSVQIITNDYQEHEKNITEVKLANLYSFRKTEASFDDDLKELELPNKNPKLSFLFYTRKEGNEHYETISQSGSVFKERTRRLSKTSQKTYLFDSSNLPSYFNYLIFQYIYGFNSKGTLGVKTTDSILQYRKKPAAGKELGPPTSDKDGTIGTKIEFMYKVYQDRLSGRPITEPLFRPQFGGQLGGQVKQYVNTYLQNSMNLDTKNTYYIVVDLDLYPGTSMTSSQRYRLSCANNYDRMREAWSDIFGLQYESGELDTSSVQSPIEQATATVEPSAPMAEASVIPSKGGSVSRTKTRKQQLVHKFTRRIRELCNKSDNKVQPGKKKTRKHKIKVKRNTRRR